MPLIIELDAVLLKKGKSGVDLVRATGHTPANVSKFRQGRIRSVRLTTLHAICRELSCQPGDLIKYVTEEELDELVQQRARIEAERKKAGLPQPIEPEKVYVVDLTDE